MWQDKTEYAPPVLEISGEAFGHSWTMDDDRRFWRQLHGITGLMWLWRDAHRLTGACVRVAGHPSDRAFMVARKHVMTFCILLTLLETVPRMIYAGLPHFFARFAALTFCEMLGRAELVAEEFPDGFADSEQYDIRNNQYRSAAGAAAR